MQYNAGIILPKLQYYALLYPRSNVEQFKFLLFFQKYSRVLSRIVDIGTKCAIYTTSSEMPSDAAGGQEEIISCRRI